MSGPVHDLERLTYSDEDGVEDGAIESDEPALQCEAAVEAQRPPFPEEHARLSEDRPRIIGRLQPPEWVEVWAGGRLAEEGGGRLAMCTADGQSVASTARPQSYAADALLERVKGERRHLYKDPGLRCTCTRPSEVE